MPLTPLVDDDGVTLVADNPQIDGPHRLIRGVSAQHLSPDGKGGQRLSSMLYNAGADLDSGMSTDSEPLVLEANLTAAQHVSSKAEWVGAVVLTAGQLRDVGLLVGYDPIPGQNPFHCQGWGSLTRGQKRVLAGQAEWLIPVADCDLT